MKPAHRFLILGLALSGLLWGQSSRLVQSIPAGTGLEQPGLPFAKTVWVEMIQGAKTRLDFAHFYVANVPGSALDPVLQALEAAGKRGVKIRFLLSDTPRMLAGDPATLARLRAIPNLELRLFKLPGGILHAKYFIADGKDLFLGSQNFDWRALEHIHETGLQTREPALVKGLGEIFEVDWTFAQTGKMPSFPPAKPPVPGSFEVLGSPAALTPPSLRAALPALLELLGQARQSIRIQLLQYSPETRSGYWPTLDVALRAAAIRGVKVQLLVSDWCLKSPNLHHLKSLAALPNLEVRYAAIPNAPQGPIPYARVIHTKMMSVDEQVLWVGTSNWEADYFEHSRNVELVLRDPSLAQQGIQIFQRLWTSPVVHRIEAGGHYVPRDAAAGN